VGLLSTQSPLADGAVWQSLPYIPGEFNSLTINVKADSNMTIVVEWSSDGTHWDTSTSYATDSDVARTIGMVVTNKWVRFRATNISSSAQTYLRLETYGVVTNNATLAILGNTILDNLPVFIIGNLQDNIMGIPNAWNTSYKSYQFAGISGSSVNNVSMFYNDLLFRAYDATESVFVNDSLAGNGMVIEGEVDTTQFAAVGSSSMSVYSPDVLHVFDFDWCCNIVEGYEGAVGVGHVEASSDIGGGLVLTDFLGFGIYNSKPAIFVVRGAIVTVIPQDDWNNDRFDGTGNVGKVLNIGVPDQYRIIVNTNGQVSFQIQASFGQYWTANTYRGVPAVSGFTGGFASFLRITEDGEPDVPPGIYFRSWVASTMGQYSKGSAVSTHVGLGTMTLNTDLPLYLRNSSSSSNFPRNMRIKRVRVTDREDAKTDPKFDIFTRIGRCYILSGASWSSIGTNNQSNLEFSTAGTSNFQNDIATIISKSNEVGVSEDLDIQMYPDAYYYLIISSNNAPSGSGNGGLVQVAVDFECMGIGGS